MNDLRESTHWYALYTRSHFEKKVNFMLQEKGLESYLPVHTVLRRWSDRWKKIEEPLFSCYVFVRMPFQQRMLAVQTDGVVRIVSFTGNPAPIPDSEIDAVRKVLERCDNYETTQLLPIGQPVEVIRGSLAGVQGRLIEHRGQSRLLVGIQQIGQALSVEIHSADVQPVRSSTACTKPAFSKSLLQI